VSLKKFDHFEKNIPETTFNPEFLHAMMNKPELIRNVALVGHLHHGKTLLMDIFVANTHPKLISYNEDLKYTDSRIDE